MVYQLTGGIRRAPEVGSRQSQALEKRLDQCIAIILCLLVLLNIILWFVRLCFHTSTLIE